MIEIFSLLELKTLKKKESIWDRVEDNLMKEEWNAWQKMFSVYCEVHGITREQANKDDKRLRPFFREVQKWGNHYLRLRYHQESKGKWDILSDETCL